MKILLLLFSISLTILTIPLAFAEGGGGIDCPDAVGSYAYVDNSAIYDTTNLGDDEFGLLSCDYKSLEQNVVPFGSIEVMFHTGEQISDELSEEYGCGEKLGEELSPLFVFSATHFAVITFSTSGLQNVAENIITQIEQNNLATICTIDSDSNSQEIDDETDEELEKIIKKMDEPIEYAEEESELIEEEDKEEELVDVPELDFAVILPQWIKDNAEWWSSDQITDDDFSSGIEYLINEGIIVIPPTEMDSEKSDEIPGWVKFNAGWWAEGQITDSEFIDGLQYLISKGIISVAV